MHFAVFPSMKIQGNGKEEQETTVRLISGQLQQWEEEN
jgi:hypothetical protein